MVRDIGTVFRRTILAGWCSALLLLAYNQANVTCRKFRGAATQRKSFLCVTEKCIFNVSMFLDLSAILTFLLTFFLLYLMRCVIAIQNLTSLCLRFEVAGMELLLPTSKDLPSLSK